MASHRKDILVTGASGRIGQAIVRGLPRDRFSVHLTSRKPQQLHSLYRDLKSQGFVVSISSLDLSHAADAGRIVKQFFARAKNPYALIGAAGTMGAMGTYANIGWLRWQRTFAENFTGHALMIHDFIRRFPKNAAGGRILVFSGAGLGASARYDHISAYSTAKAALVHLVEALAPELKIQRITINAIAPGAVWSGMTRQTLAAGPKAGALLKDAQACQRSGGAPPELAAQLVNHLLEPRAKGITGRLLSARFDQPILLKHAAQVAGDDHYFRLRRIDHALFKPASRRP